MLLKRLEIQGFKSFAERMEIEYGPGITVIVGPNGCGKSNLTEAVQWVLGEQNARVLRGYRMDDVIFAGTSRRRPHGMAEVSLIFDNTSGALPLEYKEVSITRRVYRSGEGEYFINKKPCRLRDIQELFLASGINKAASSIIAQGKIEEFISQRPEERRLYLEELAGISKYRQRKAESVTKLGETEQVLLRLQDVLGELKRQLAPLAEQARTANQYNEYQDQLKRFEELLLRSQHARTTAKMRTLAGTVENLQAGKETNQQQVDRLAQELKDLDSAIKERREQVSVREQEYGQIQHELQSLQILAVRAEEKYSSSLSRRTELERRLQAISRKDQEIEAEMREMAGQQVQTRDRQALAQQQCLAAERALQELEKSRQQVNSAWEANNGELFEALHQKTVLTSQIKELQSRKEAIKRQQANLSQKSSENTARCEQIRQQTEQQGQLFQQRTAALEQITTELEQARQRVADIGREQEQVMSVLQKRIQENERHKTRLHLLQESENNRDGYQRGVKAIIQARAREETFCSGILGLVEDLFTIDPRYETALYTALGRAAQYFVCDTPEAAQRALTYLKKQEVGRASFLPLTAVRRWLEKERPPRYAGADQVLGRGADLVVCAEEYRNVAEFLLGHTYFADHLQSARQFAESNYFRVRVVTLDGDLIQPGGLITGGKEARPVQFAIKRKREIVQLSDDLNRGQQALDELEKRRSALTAERTAIMARIKELETTERSLEKERNKLEQAISSLSRELKQLEEFGQVWLLEGNEENYRWGDLDQEIERSGKELFRAKESELELEQRRARIEQEKKDCEANLHQLNSQLSDHRVHLVSLNQESKYLEQKVQQLGNLVREQQRGTGQVESSLGELTAEMAGLEQQRQQQRQQLEALNARKIDIEQDLHFRRKQADAKESYYRAKEKRYLRIKQLNWQREQRAHNLELQAQHLGEQLEEIAARALELECDLDQASGGELERQEENSLKEQITTLKDRLGSFGEVNFAAPGEYAALEERRSFLERQNEDLDEGREALLNVIGEMDQIVTDRFRKIYETVKENFQQVFGMLFDGGTAELFLTDEKDLMASGIDVRVLPRGKKPRHLSLLSGGEKALTGIAFLFALLQTRPSPFYFLDEIEAFLDESNLVRFADFLTKMAAKAQIILISHRPRTMQVADALYGITMEEPGVSKLVAVELVERKHSGSERELA